MIILKATKDYVYGPSVQNIIQKNKERVRLGPPGIFLWRRGPVVITTAQLHSTKPKLRFCKGSNLAFGLSENRDGEDL